MKFDGAVDTLVFLLPATNDENELGGVFPSQSVENVRSDLVTGQARGQIRTRLSGISRVAVTAGLQTHRKHPAKPMQVCRARSFKGWRSSEPGKSAEILLSDRFSLIEKKTFGF